MRDVAKTRKRFLSVMATNPYPTFRQSAIVYRFCLPRRRPDRESTAGRALLSRVRCRGWNEVKLPLAFLIEHTIASRATTAYVQPIARHHHDRPWAKILR